MKTTATFQKMKEAGEPIAMVTAYDYPSARMAEKAEMDLILVGDSLGMVVLGYDSTVYVTIEDMVRHTAAVRRGAANTFVVSDLPFLTYHGAIDDTLRTAGRLIQEGGANAVKLEGGDEVAKTTARLTSAGIPVCAHLGLTPQSVGVLGGYKVQGKNAAEAEKLIDEARQLEESGAFMLVLECVPRQLAQLISQKLTIPVIGIGAGSDTDGQVLVYHDLLGYGDHQVPRFVKQFAHVTATMEEGLASYKKAVKTRTFPDENHSFTMKPEQLESLYGGQS